MGPFAGEHHDSCRAISSKFFGCNFEMGQAVLLHVSDSSPSITTGFHMFEEEAYRLDKF